mgnify:CR=1 FL=1
MARTLIHFLYFTAKERSGTLFLLAFILLCSALPFIYAAISPKQVLQEEEKKLISTFKNQNNNPGKTSYANESTAHDIPYNNDAYNPPGPASHFYFDPNTATTGEWMQLGIKEKTALTIQKYVSKGGHFDVPEDISKIWGLSKQDVNRLLPYVRIVPNHKAPGKNNCSAYEQKPYPKWEKKTYQKVDINLADTSIFIALPGIGSGYARRIVNFRERLGGFYAVEQVAETYGLPDSTFQKIKPYLFVTEGNIKKININAATTDELKKHPYIRYQLANVIVNYRLQHGDYKQAEDLKKIMILTDEAYEKIKPYIALQ